MKRRILALAAALALVAALVMPMAALADTAGDTTVTGDLAAGALSITAPTPATDLSLTYVETAQTLISATPADQGKVTSTTPFIVTVTDKMDTFGAVAKTSGSDGKMVEATGSAYVNGGLILKNPVTVGSTYAEGGVAAGADLVSGGTVILTSTKASVGGGEVNMLATVTQALDLTFAGGYDVPAPDTNVYRIVLTFTITVET